jgi:hypothetical protein
MCKAHVLRFDCAHGLLMSIEVCPTAPCPNLKMTGVRLPKQPYRCYNCQRKRCTTSSTDSSATTSSACDSSLASISSRSSLSSSPPNMADSVTPLKRAYSGIDALPGVAKQPNTAVQYSRKSSCKMEKPYRFTCTSSNHYPVPHYATLPSFLPHQDHPCPPCQLERLRDDNILEACTNARKQYPSLQAEQLVKNGRSQAEWEGKMTLERYVDEKRQEEKEYWFHLTRKWTQDLRKSKVLVAEEDGLGLMT